MFSQKHYIAVAKVIKDCLNDEQVPNEDRLIGIYHVLNRLAIMFKADSDKFDPGKFARAAAK